MELTASKWREKLLSGVKGHVLEVGIGTGKNMPDPVQGLKEIKRVCRDGGEIVMLEHVRSHNKIMGPLMDSLNFVPLHL